MNAPLPANDIAGATKGKRIIVVANRLPVKLVERNERISLAESDGGLVRALTSYFERSGKADHMSMVWVGMADFPVHRWERYLEKRPSPNDLQVVPLFAEKREYTLYYYGFCNATIWPLFHYFPSYAEYSALAFKAYERINEVFRDKVRSILQPGDIVWVHDYHLMLLPGLLREKDPNLSIGYFHHIPFPSYEIFRLLHRPWKLKIMSGLLGADVVGFHTHQYVEYFLDVARKDLGIANAFHEVRFNERKVAIEAFPISIDFRKFHDAPETPAIQRDTEAIRSAFPNHQIIFSVDRLDYTKGITHRLSGFARFLELYPDWKEKIVFILVVVPSRQIVSKYNERKKLIEEQVSQINGRFSTLQWQPILYRYNTLSFGELIALYRLADVALITPLRDGMNLVAKEFVASKRQMKGVLILSELAGSAQELYEAILVNPTDENEVAESISAALAMPPEVQERNISLMQDRLRNFDVVNWVHSFLSMLEVTHERQITSKGIPVDEEQRRSWHDSFQQAERRLFLIDYDGTLVPFASRPEDAVPPKAVVSWMCEATKNKRTRVAIVSGRPYALLERWFGHLPVVLVAEHGMVIRYPGEAQPHRLEEPGEAHPRITALLDLFQQRNPGTFVEKKEYSIAWHYRALSDQEGMLQSRELLECLESLVRSEPLRVIDGNKVVEIRNARFSKGTAAQTILHRFPADFTLAIGDDATDEDMFEALGDEAFTIKVGANPSRARFQLADQAAVIPFLTELTLSK